MLSYRESDRWVEWVWSSVISERREGKLGDPSCIGRLSPSTSSYKIGANFYKSIKVPFSYKSWHQQCNTISLKIMFLVSRNFSEWRKILMIRSQELFNSAGMKILKKFFLGFAVVQSDRQIRNYLSPHISLRQLAMIQAFIYEWIDHNEIGRLNMSIKSVKGKGRNSNYFHLLQTGRALLEIGSMDLVGQS